MARPRIATALSLCLLAAAFAPAAASAATATTSVIGGQQAVHGSFPYLAFVYFKAGSEGEACSGTVVSSNVVLTAAHCVVDEVSGLPRAASGFRVVTGNVEWESGERVVSAVSGVAVDPEYTRSGEYAHWGDAAILQLSQPIAAPAVRLATSETWGAGTSALMAGWGKVTASQVGASPLLHYGTTVIQSAAYCGSKAVHFHAAGQLCVIDAPNHVYSVCSGDSGGPLLVVAPGTTNEPLEIGIASFVVNEECAPTSPQYYTRADLVSAWVKAQIAALAPPPAPPPSAPAVLTPAPAATLPRLGGGRAKAHAKTVLSQALGLRFDRRSDYRIACETLEATRQRCAVSWRGAAFRYSGTVTVYYVLEGDQVVLKDRFRIRRVAARCAKQRCPVRVFRG
jgi:secreted trypsin-like serine protease